MSEQTSLNVQAAKKLATVEAYEFEPIKGYPMLRWKGKRPFTSTQYYPAQHKESHGEEVDGWINRIYWGDNLQVMSHLLKEFRGKVDLIYIDPPFDSKADYKKVIKSRGSSISNDLGAFEEKQYTDIWSNDDYLQFIYERLILLKELLSSNGVIFFHCDSSRGHYLRCILDEIFGTNSFINSLVWQRSHAHGDTGQGAKHFGRVLDSIYIYAKSSDFEFNPQYKPYSDKIISRDYKYVEEETGERYRLMPVDGPGGAAKGNPYYEFLGVKNFFRYSQQRMKELYDKGEIVLSSTGKTLHRKRYLKDAKGTPVTELWNDLNRVSPTSNERLDYPTQKPEALLDRVLRTCSSPGDLVFDCFMGSGTTQAVAMKLGRRFIGADINMGAIQTTTKRLIHVAQEIRQKPPELNLSTEGKEDTPATFYTGFSVHNVNHYDVFRNPLEAKELLIQALEIQPLPGNTIYDGEKDGRMVKIMPFDRIATRADLNPLISGLNYRKLEKQEQQSPGSAVEHLLLVCMGHEPDLAAYLQKEVGFKLDIEVVDILRDKANLEFKRDAEADITVEDGQLTIRAFYPMNLLQKLSLMKENVEDWRELTESVMVDFNYDGGVFEPSIVDIPGKDELVKGTYPVPESAGTIRVKITDLLSESLEQELNG
ncbi:site-specific DNA-methyltransferase [Tunicatimonas pelagia]|uniref:site-specific DNA-methyltransferase n=1 Tax=Tunicatimonas pelagia TaxID=931531 RepID=UPI0026657A79|nr:site-specific DNA-methyltransferase [Tunicatimonas pelagia]WKN46435.1 site-specific DNA-methyltransferase [Tunicatimonas pelagia]